MSLIEESQAENACLGWFEELGYTHAFGPDLAPEGSFQERATYKQVVLEDRFRQSLVRLNPGIPVQSLDDAARQVIHGNATSLMLANRQFHRWLTDVRARMRSRITIILRRHKYPPDMEQRAIELVMKQAEAIGEEWVA